MNLDTEKLQAALIRMFWTGVFPVIGTLVERGIEWWSTSGNPESIGVSDGVVIVGISMALYGLKKYFYSDTKW